MKKLYLLLDVNFLAYRAYHSTPGLQTGGVPTAVTFGLLRDVVTLTHKFSTPHVVFCFDKGTPLRELVLPGYKQSRRKLLAANPAEQEKRQLVYEQVQALKNAHLPALGYRNTHAAQGYEADDVIGSICQWLREDESAIIVASDHDYFQLLNDQVAQWLPNTEELMTATTFTERWGLKPKQWVNVKALAGCNSDDIPGVRGVGELTAAKFHAGTLKKDTAAYAKCHSGMAVEFRNLPLVRLPYAGCPEFALHPDAVTPDKWRRVCRDLGLSSLVERFPRMDQEVVA